MDVFEDRLGVLQVGEPRGVLTLQAAQIAEREQRAGQHLIVGRARSDLHSLLIERARMCVVAGGFADRAFAGEHTGKEPLAGGLRQQLARPADLLFRRRLVSFRQVVAQEQARADFQVDIGLAAEDLEGCVRIAAAGIGIGARSRPGPIDQLLRGIRGRGAMGCRDPERKQHPGRCKANPTTQWRNQR